MKWLLSENKIWSTWVTKLVRMLWCNSLVIVVYRLEVSERLGGDTGETL